MCLLVSEGSERGGVGARWWRWRGGVVCVCVCGGRGCIVNQAALPEVGTCQSGERRVGTRPNDSSTALYKYSRAGSTRLLLLVAKKPRDNGVSPSRRKVFNSLLIVFQSHPDLKENRISAATIKTAQGAPFNPPRRVIKLKAT